MFIIDLRSDIGEASKFSLINNSEIKGGMVLFIFFLYNPTDSIRPNYFINGIRFIIKRSAFKSNIASNPEMAECTSCLKATER